MKASITAEEKLVLYFNPHDAKKMGLELGGKLGIRRDGDTFHLYTSGTSASYSILGVPKSSNVQVRFFLNNLGMEGLPVRRSRGIKSPRLSSGSESYSITLPEVFFSSVPDEHGANVASTKRSALNGGSAESRLRLAVSTINEAVVKGDAKLRVERKTGKLVVKAFVMIGG